MELRTFCTANETISRMMRKPTEWEGIFASYASDRFNIQNIQVTQKINIKKKKPIETEGTDLNRELSKKRMR